MFIRKRSKQTGDTLIEVLLATSILAFVVAGTAIIMNDSLSRTQLSLERTQVQAAIQGQGSILRALRDAAVGDRSPEADVEWNTVVSYAIANNPAVQPAVCSQTAYPGERFAFQNTDGAAISSWLHPVTLNTATTVPTNASSLPAPGDGLWIEAYRGGTAALPYYDFYIKACWEGTGDNGQQELRTVVRLYGQL